MGILGPPGVYVYTYPIYRYRGGILALPSLPTVRPGGRNSLCSQIRLLFACATWLAESEGYLWGTERGNLHEAVVEAWLHRNIVSLSSHFKTLEKILLLENPSPRMEAPFLPIALCLLTDEPAPFVKLKPFTGEK